MSTTDHDPFGDVSVLPGRLSNGVIRPVMALAASPRYYYARPMHFQGAPVGTKVMDETGFLWVKKSLGWVQITGYGRFVQLAYSSFRIGYGSEEMLAKAGRCRVIFYPPWSGPWPRIVGGTHA